jgi:hypothetical protein
MLIEADTGILLRLVNRADQQHAAVTHILTLNPGDFHRYPSITAISPTDLLGAQTPAPGQAP